MSKTKVRRFWLQATKSFKEGAPQRESYLSDLAFNRACVAYENEWRAEYHCKGEDCNQMECPQCSAQGVA